MFKHLQEIDYKLYERYLTLEKNIKAGSNSFYDAYLDLQEQFVKAVAVFCGFDVKARETCGELLRRDDIKNFFKDVLRVDDFTYTKMQDYTLKVNAHKHKGEKNIQIDTIVSYMRIIYDATIAFAIYKKVKINEFDASYFISIFSEFEKENTALKIEMVKLKEELLVSVESGKLKDSDIDAYRSLLSQSEIVKLDLEEQNQVLHRQISKLKDIEVVEITADEFCKLKAINDVDPYLHAKNHREQLQIEGFEDRIELDEYNIARRYQKTSKKESLEFRVKRANAKEKSHKRALKEYFYEEAIAW